MVETYKGIDRLTFQYDYMGRRVEKCVYSNNTLTSKTLFVYDGFKCVEELDALDSNAVVMRHAWQPFDVGLDVILATTDGNGTSCFLHDANKNIAQKNTANGALQETYAYAPFGRNIGISHAHVGFSSEITDYLLNLSYYTYRYYVPIWGRWMSIDIANDFASANLYSYVNNTPNDLYDHLGLFCCKNRCASGSIILLSIEVGYKPGTHNNASPWTLDGLYDAATYSNVLQYGQTYSNYQDIFNNWVDRKGGNLFSPDLNTIWETMDKMEKTVIERDGVNIWGKVKYKLCKTESCLIFWQRLNWKSISKTIQCDLSSFYTKPYFKHRLGEKADYYEVLNSLPINLAKTGAVQAECMKQFINAMKTE